MNIRKIRKIRKKLDIIYKYIHKFISPLKAFTLLELIVVITILAILSSVAFFSVN
jgi:prepilin-type N-terminal cleavage/methylation domain-containing protein